MSSIVEFVVETAKFNSVYEYVNPLAGAVSSAAGSLHSTCPLLVTTLGELRLRHIELAAN
jgi:hypothetical protein